MASEVRNSQVEETPSERFERVFKEAVDRHRRADARRAERERKAKMMGPQRTKRKRKAKIMGPQRSR